MGGGGVAQDGHNLEFKIYYSRSSVPEDQRPPDGELFGQGRTMLKVPGQFTGTLRGRDTTVQQEIYVVISLSYPFCDVLPSKLYC